MTLLFLCIDLALFFNSYVNPVALAHLNWKYYIVYDCWLAFECVIVYFFFIETRRTPLEEIAKFFDGDAAIIGGDAATEKARAYLEEEHVGGDHKTTSTQVETLPVDSTEKRPNTEL
jgi:hypothetical protein